MGGKEGNRGYLYQAISSVIEACINNNWDSISVESNTENDKVDIVLYSSNLVNTAIQVKSSINLFGKNDVKSWIENMIADVESEHYKLVLIGGCVPSANDFVSSVNKFNRSNKLDKRSEDALHDFKHCLEQHSVSIDVLPFNEEHLISIARDKLNKFLSSKGYCVNYGMIDGIANVLVSRSFFWATNGRAVNRDEYIENILNCINGFENAQSSSLVIKGYDFSDSTLSKNGILAPLDYNSKIKHFRKELIDEGKQLIDKINEIKLPKASITSQDAKRMMASGLAEYSKDEKAILKGDISRLWSISVGDDFFFVGNLLEVKPYFGFVEYRGKKNEKEKCDLIYDLNEIICQIEAVDLLMKSLAEIELLPLVLSNNGTKADENITIDLDLSNLKDSIFEFKLDGFEGFSEKESDRFACKIVENNLISSIFYQCRTNNIETMPNNSKSLIYGNEFDFFDMKCEIEDAIAGSNNVRYNLKSLRAGENIWLQPCIVFKKDALGKNIPYSILSAHSGKKIQGTIIIEKPKG